MSKIKSLISLLLAIIMVVGIFPLTIIAEDGKHTVKFNKNYLGAENVESQEVIDGECAAEPTGVQRKGYTLKGWSTVKYGGELFDFSKPITGDITLYAQWKIDRKGQAAALNNTITDILSKMHQRYTVSFETDGGSVINPIEVKYGTAIAELIPIKANYTFLGWYTDAEFTQAYDFATEIKEDITLYAKWKKDSYTVSFNSNGGTAVESQTVEHGDSAVKPADPTKDEYTFDGWFTDAELTKAYDFTKAVEKELVLYAKWVAVVVEQPDTSLELFSDKNNVLITNTTVVYVYATSSMNLDYIELYQIVDGESIFVGHMYDDGNTGFSGDDMSGDGTYSYRFTGIPTEDTQYKFQAKISGIESNVIDIIFYNEISEESLQIMEIVDNSIVDLVEEFDTMPYEERKEAAEELLNEFVSQDQIEEESIHFDESNSMYSFMYPDGILGGIMLEEFDKEFNGRLTDAEQTGEYLNSVFELNTDNSEKKEEIGSAIILNSFPEFETSSDMIDYRTKFYNQLRSEWNDKGLKTHVDVSVSVEDYKNLGEYDVIIISTHGGTYQWYEGLEYNKSPMICLAEKSTKGKDKQYSAELKNKQIVKINGCYYILPSFFEGAYGEDGLEGKFVFSESCEFMGRYDEVDTSMSDAILNCGVVAVVGFHNSVYATYSREFMRTYINELIDDKTVEESFETAKTVNGATHKIWYENSYGENSYDNNMPVAYPILNGETSATLVSLGLRNGDFELTASAGAVPTYWSAAGDARSLSILGNITPFGEESTKMAIITTGVGSKTTATFEAGTEGSYICQKFTVPENVSTLEFNYNFVSEEPMEWVGSQFNDAFGFRLTCDETFVENIYETINSSTWTPVYNIDFNGGDKTVYETGWKTATIDVSEYCGKVVTIYFIVYDVGDSIYDSACLLDNVVIT